MSTENVDQPDALLIDVKAVARALGCSARHVHRMVESGQMPKPVRLGRSLVRFNRQTVVEWIASGCPAVGGKVVQR